MKIVHYRDIEPRPVEVDDACGTTIRWLIAREDGAEKFAMRLFELEQGGATPLHTHQWEHEVFVLAGTGTVWREGEEVPLRPGTAIFVPPGEKHRFRNTGNEIFRFLCLIPVTD